MGMTEPAFAGPMEGHREVLSGLRMSGLKGKVNVALDASSLIIEAKHGQSTNFPIGSVRTFNHHQTHLMPPLTQYLGALLVMSGLWLIETVPVRNTILLTGSGLLAAWLLTRQPTLTVELTNGEHHVITGPDSTLMQLAYVLGRVLEGMSLEEARVGLDLIDLQRHHPVTSTPEALVAPSSIAAMLHGAAVTSASAENVLDAFLEEEETAPLSPSTSVVNINIHPTDEYLPSTTIDTSAAGGGLFGRASTALNEGRMPAPDPAPVHPRSPVDPEEAERLRNGTSSPFAASDVGWLEAPSLPQPTQNVEAPDFLPSFYGPEGTSSPRHDLPAPTQAPTMGHSLPPPAQAPMHETREAAPAAVPTRGVVSRATVAPLPDAPPRQLGGNLSPRGQQTTHTHLQPDRVPRPKSGVLQSLFNALVGLRPPSRQEQEYTQMYGDPDARFRASQGAELSSFQLARLRSDSEHQAMLAEEQHRMAGSTGGERSHDRFRQIIDTIARSDLPPSDQTLTGDWQRELGPQRFDDLHEVGSQSLPSTTHHFANLDRLDG